MASAIMSNVRLNPGWNILLIAVGVATIVLGMAWPKPVSVPRTALAVSAVASSVPPAAREVGFAPRRRMPAVSMTYCPGPSCAVALKARRDCEARKGEFGAEPDFVCRFHGDVYRMVCDDIDDERQCGMMSHTDLEHARRELVEYFEKRQFVDVDLLADFNDGKLRCVESAREIECRFTKRSTGYEHPNSPIVCNWMGCSFPFAASAD